MKSLGLSLILSPAPMIIRTPKSERSAMREPRHECQSPPPVHRTLNQGALALAATPVGLSGAKAVATIGEVRN